MKKFTTIATLKEIPIYRYDIFTFNKKAKHHWLQKICFYILKKLGCYFTEIDAKVVYSKIDNDSIIDLILEAREKMNQYYKSSEMRYLILGRDKLSQFKHEYHLRLPTHFDENFEFMDLKIIYVPWFEGILLLPDIKKE